jgi:hypothetical protein
MAQGRAEPDTRFMTRATMPSAPPDSASSAPIIEPSAMSRPTLPTVVPSPVLNDVTVLPGPSAATRPSTPEPTMSARNGCHFAQAMSTTTAAIPSTAARMSWPDPAEGVAASAASTIMRLAYPPCSVFQSSLQPLFSSCQCPAHTSAILELWLAQCRTERA